MRGQQLIRISSILLLVQIGVIAEVVKSPPMTPIRLGSECQDWTWLDKSEPTGSYDGDTYRLAGRGTGVYWCWDRCGFAFCSSVPLENSFQFTCRIAEMPEDGPGLVGIMVRAGTFTGAPVLSLRWDYYWQKQKGSGLSWFNRQTNPAKIGLQNNGQKGCMIGTTPITGQGCLGEGYENNLAGYTSRSDLWLRVKRVKVGNKSTYNLFARYGNAAWSEIEPQTSANNPCGGSVVVTAKTLPAFEIPTDTGAVYVGVFTSGDIDAKTEMAAKFDNIELEYEPATSVASTKRFASTGARQWRAIMTKEIIRATYTGSKPPSITRVFLLNAQGRISPAKFSISGNSALISSPDRATGVLWVVFEDNAGRQVVPIVNSLASLQ